MLSSSVFEIAASRKDSMQLSFPEDFIILCPPEILKI